jgi:hypothetical protein
MIEVHLPASTGKVVRRGRVEGRVSETSLLMFWIMGGVW